MIHKFFIIRGRLSCLKASPAGKPGSLFLERFGSLFVFAVVMPCVIFAVTNLIYTIFFI